jgi:hypothetical protein
MAGIERSDTAVGDVGEIGDVEVLEVQAVPFEEVRMVPEPPAAKNVLFP